MNKQFMYSEDPEMNLFQKLLSELKSSIVNDKLIYGQTKQGLKFLRNLFTSTKDDVLFVNLRESQNFPVETVQGVSVFETRKQLLAQGRDLLLK